MSAMSSQRSAFRMRFAHAADGFAVSAVVTLPWSISVALILIVLWLIAVILALAPAEIGQELATLAGGLPVALAVLMICGMFWANGQWAERLGSADAFFRLLTIPLLLAQFRRSERGPWILIGYLASCTALLTLSWAFVVWPQITFLFTLDFGVPVKSAESQSGEFLICVFALLVLAMEMYRRGRWCLAASMAILALTFLASILYVLLSFKSWSIVRLVSLYTIPVLLLLLVHKSFGAKAMISLIAGTAIVCAVLWAFSPSLRAETAMSWYNLKSHPEQWLGVSRPVFWSKSISFINEAPILGHGTGSIRGLFDRAAVGQSGVAAQVTVNPQQQTLAVGIQLGLVGMTLLWAMWLSHLLLFHGNSLPHWIGLVVVIQNILSSMLSTHLVDFTEAWIYVIGVGVAGGMVHQLRADGQNVQDASRGQSAVTIRL